MNPAGQVFGAYRVATAFPMFGGYPSYPTYSVLGLPSPIRPGLAVDPGSFLSSVGMTPFAWRMLSPSQKAVIVSRSGMVPALSVAGFIAQVDAYAMLTSAPQPFYAQPYYAQPFGGYYGGYNPFFVRSFGDRSGFGSPNLSTSPHSNANPNTGAKPAGLAQIRPAGQTVAASASLSGVFGFAVGAVVGVVAAKHHWLGL